MRVSSLLFLVVGAIVVHTHGADGGDNNACMNGATVPVRVGQGAEDSVQVIKSNNYPGNYDTADCMWRIEEVTNRYKLSITGAEFELDNFWKDDCLKVYDGEDADADLIGSYCRSTNSVTRYPDWLTNGSVAYVTFKSNAWWGGAKGFELVVTTSACPSSERILEATPEKRVLTSAGATYDKDLNCKWEIQAPEGQTEQKVQYSIDDFQLEDEHLGSCSDYLMIGDTRKCGTDQPEDGNSEDRNYVGIQFKSNKVETAKKGFKMVYWADGSN